MKIPRCWDSETQGQKEGKLKKEGVSIADVRQEAIEKMNDPKLLAQTVSQEPDAEPRASAQDRLKEHGA